MDTARWPAGEAVTPRSSSIFMITAVDESTNPIAPITATAGGQPNASPTPDSSSAADQHLREPEPEDLLAQRPQLGGPHLEPDQEQEQHDAQFGDVQDGLRVVEERETEGADQQAGTEVAEDGAQAELAKQRDRDDGGRQQDDRMTETDACRFRGQPRLLRRRKTGRAGA